MKKKLTLILLLCMIFSLFPSCSEDVPPTALIYVGDISMNAYEEHVLFLTETSLLADISVETIFASEYLAVETDESGKTTSNTLEDLFDKKFSSLLVRASTTEEANEILALAKKKNIPVVFYGVSPGSEQLTAYENAWYVCFSPALQGEIAGAIVGISNRNALIPDKNENLLLDTVFLYSAENETEKTQIDFAIHSIEDTGLFINSLMHISAGADANYLETVYTEHGNTIETFICVNDVYIVSTVQYLLEVSPTFYEDSQFTITGIGNTPEVLELVSQGYVLGVAFCNPVTLANALSTLTMNTTLQLNITSGTSYKLDANRILYLPVEAVTIQNVERALQTYNKD